MRRSMAEIKRCAKCELQLPVERFDSRPNGRWASYCKACLSLYCRSHYVRNSAAHNARRRAARHKYKLRNRAFVLQYLLEHPCVDCGETNPLFLEFDHVLASEKTENVSTLSAQGRSLQDLIREIQCCVVRCIGCHRRRTARQFGWAKGIPNDIGM
jgi:hypothetical protein